MLKLLAFLAAITLLVLWAIDFAFQQEYLCILMVPLGECPQATRPGLLALAAVCATLLPFHLSAQWSTGSGGAIYYNGGNVGIGTAGTANPLLAADERR